MERAFSEAEVLTQEEIEAIFSYTEDPNKNIEQIQKIFLNTKEKISKKIVDYLNEIVRVNNPRVRYIISELITESLVLCWSKLPYDNAQKFYTQVDSLIGSAVGKEEESLLKLKCKIARVFWIESPLFYVSILIFYL